MAQLFRLKNDKNNRNWRMLSLDADRLRILNAPHHTQTAFDTAFEKDGFFKRKLEIPFTDITRLAHPEGSSTELRITHGGKTSLFTFDREAELRTTTEQIQTALGFNSRTDKVSTWRAISTPLISLFVFAVFSLILYNDAELVASGREVDVTGRRRLFKMIFSWLAEMLGVKGSIILIAAVGVALLWFLYRRLTKPPTEVVYE